jgi:hypothetical protein
MEVQAKLQAIAAVALLGACTAETDDRGQGPAETETIMLETPRSIATEHRELHEILGRAGKEAGELGAAARNLEGALTPHFFREEQIATPPLSLLSALARGEVTSDMRSVLPMTDALERELPQMLREHEAIKRAAGEFGAAAEKAGRAEYVRFAENLAAHARQEEEILYPAAIVVGRYVKLATSDNE